MVLGVFCARFPPREASSIRRASDKRAQQERARVMDLFREWDTDGSGIITAAEFERALRLAKANPRRVVPMLYHDRCNFTAKVTSGSGWRATWTSLHWQQRISHALHSAIAARVLEHMTVHPHVIRELRLGDAVVP